MILRKLNPGLRKRVRENERNVWARVLPVTIRFKNAPRDAADALRAAGYDVGPNAGQRQCRAKVSVEDLERLTEIGWVDAVRGAPDS